MTKYVDRTYLETEECCNCGMVFAMTQDFKKRRLKDRKSFYCPSGHHQYYTGETEVSKLKRKLDHAQQEAQRQQQNTIQARSERDASNRRYGRIRDRVKNGVCPCCNRTFQNLASHMANKHPNFGKESKLKALRKAYGLTQCDLADELGISTPYISIYENKKQVPRYAGELIEAWMDSQ